MQVNLKPLDLTLELQITNVDASCQEAERSI